MGADIHLFVELKRSSGGFEALAEGAFALPRDSTFFAALGGVGASASSVRPLVLPRGLPSDVSREVADNYFVPVLDDAKALAWGIGEHYTPPAARELVAKGLTHWHDASMTQPLVPATHGYVANPAWRHAS